MLTAGDGQTFRVLSQAEHDEMFRGLDHLALDDRGLWENARTHHGRPLFGRAHASKKYEIGVLDDDGAFEPTSWTDHGMRYVPPATAPGRRADHGQVWHEANVRVHATHV